MCMSICPTYFHTLSPVSYWGQSYPIFNLYWRSRAEISITVLPFLCLYPQVHHRLKPQELNGTENKYYCLREFLLVFPLPHLLLLSLFCWPHLLFPTSKGGVPQVSPKTSVLFYILSVGDIIQSHSIKRYLYDDVTHIYISSLYFSLNNRLIYSTSYLTLSNRHLKITVSETKIFNFHSKPASPTVFLISSNAYFIHPVAQMKNFWVILDSSLSHSISRKYSEYPISTAATQV